MPVDRLSQLPIELQDAILEFILLPADLNSLCLTSKVCSKIAIPHLYKKIAVPYHAQDPEWRRIARLAQSAHLRFVRELDIGHYPVHIDRLCKPLKQLIRALQPNTLSRFYFDSTARPVADDLNYLFSSQALLKEANVNFCVEAPSLRDLIAEEQSTVQKLRLRKVSIDLAEWTAPDQFHRFLDMIDTRAVTSVRLWYFPGKIGLDERVSYPGNDSMLKWCPASLKSLSLGEITFPSSDIWRLSDYPSLTRLELRDCWNVGHVLDEVMRPRVEHLIIQFSDMSPQHDFYSCVSFLERTENLKLFMTTKKLHLPWLFTLERALGRHSNLQALMIDCFSTHSHRMSSWLNSRPFYGLRQLAMRLNDNERIGRIDEQCVVILKSLPHLEVLNVFHESWVDQTKAERMANEVFQQIPSAHPLKILAFGKQWFFSGTLEAHSHGAPRRQCFKRPERTASCQNDVGPSVAEHVSENKIKYLCPGSDILSYQFDPVEDTPSIV